MCENLIRAPVHSAITLPNHGCTVRKKDDTQVLG